MIDYLGSYKIHPLNIPNVLIDIRILIKEIAEQFKSLVFEKVMIRVCSGDIKLDLMLPFLL